jgi:hypothetical protein
LGVVDADESVEPGVLVGLVADMQRGDGAMGSPGATESLARRAQMAVANLRAETGNQATQLPAPQESTETVKLHAGIERVAQRRGGIPGDMDFMTKG